MKLGSFFTQFFIVGFIAMGLAACPESRVKPDPTSALQQAYAVNEDLILAKQALNDLYMQEKARRVGNPAGKPFISDRTYDIAWQTTEDAAKIVKDLIAKARAGLPAGELKTAAEKKIAEVDAITGRKE